jgi:hypothetical protein
MYKIRIEVPRRKGARANGDISYYYEREGRGREGEFPSRSFNSSLKYFRSDSYSVYLDMDNNNSNNESKKGQQQYHESINYATQQMGENAQFSIAIAVGIFGILAIFAIINPHNNEDFWKNALWMQKPSIKAIGVVLSIAYWALILFGIHSYVIRRLFEGIVGKYHKKMNIEWLNGDIKEIAEENKLANWIVRNIWLINKGSRRYKGIYLVLIAYMGIAFFLWLFIIIL